MQWLKAFLATFLPWRWFFNPEPGADILLIRDESGSMVSFHSSEEIEAMPRCLLQLGEYFHREIIVRQEIFDTGDWVSSSARPLLSEKPDYYGSADICQAICAGLEFAIQRSQATHRRLVVTIRSDGAFHNLESAHRATQLLRKLKWRAGKTELS